MSELGVEPDHNRLRDRVRLVWQSATASHAGESVRVLAVQDL